MITETCAPRRRARGDVLVVSGALGEARDVEQDGGSGVVGGRVQPSRPENLTFFADPEFAAEFTNVVRLFLAPSREAAAHCVDEKSNLQAAGFSVEVCPPARLRRGGSGTAQPAGRRPKSGTTFERPCMDVVAGSAGAGPPGCGS